MPVHHRYRKRIGNENPAPYLIPTRESTKLAGNSELEKSVIQFGFATPMHNCRKIDRSSDCSHSCKTTALSQRAPTSLALLRALLRAAAYTYPQLPRAAVYTSSPVTFSFFHFGCFTQKIARLNQEARNVPLPTTYADAHCSLEDKVRRIHSTMRNLR